MERVQSDEPFVSEGALPIGAIASPGGASVRVVRVRPSSAEPKRNTWFLSPVVFLLAAGATFLVFYLRTASVTASTPRTTGLPDSRSGSLDMRVETEGAGLRLMWNPYSLAVEMAKSGVLEINDGGQRREIALDRNQVVNGSLVYRPFSGDVSFRLSLHSARGDDVAQVLRVLDASRRLPPLEAMVPEKSAAPKPASEPAASQYRNASDSSQNAAANRLVTQNPAPRDTAVNSERPDANRIAPTGQIASAATPQPANSSPGLSGQPTGQPTPNGETALPKSAEPQLRQAAAVADPSQQPSNQAPSVSSQPKLENGANSGAVPTKQVEIPAYVPPRPVKWVQPDGRLLGTSGPPVPVDIKVKVKIDETGHVTAAHALIDGGKRDKKLMAAVAAVVRQWVFEPAKSHGANVPSEETIVIHLGPEAQ